MVLANDELKHANKRPEQIKSGSDKYLLIDINIYCHNVYFKMENKQTLQLVHELYRIEIKLDIRNVYLNKSLYIYI